MPPHSQRKGNRTGLKPTLQDFQFINLTNDSPHVNEDDRFLIREVVMTDYHRRKRYRISRVSGLLHGKEAPGSAGSENPVSERVHGFELQPQGIERPKRKHSSSFPRNSLVDTLNASLSVSNPVANQLHESRHASSTVHISSRPHLEILPQEEIQPDDHQELRDQERSKFNDNTTRNQSERLDLLSGSLDPLILLPSTSIPHTLLFIQHYFNERSRSSLLMMSVRKSWFRASLSDAAFFKAVLSHYAASWTLRSREGDPAESLMLRMEAVNIVNKRLDEGEEGISDGTIGAVASMVTYEANNGSLDAMRTHMNGLGRMVALRGGFKKAEFPPSLQRLIAWADLTAADVFHGTPEILPFDSPNLNFPAYSGTNRPKGPFVSPKPRPTDYGVDFANVCKDLPSIFNDLRYLTTILESQNTSATQLGDHMWYSDKVYLVHRSLVYLSLYPEPEHTKLDTACCITASIYVNAHLRDLGFYARVVALMVDNLKGFLEVNGLGVVNEDQGLGNDDEDLKLFWILAFGGIVSASKSERVWFVDHLRIVSENMKVQSVPGVEKVLKKILWSKEWERHLEVLWNETLAI